MVRGIRNAKWVAIGAVIGVAFGGIAYAVVVNPPNPSNRFFACVSPSGVVKSGTIRLNVAPTKCPAATDQVQTWNAVGPTGATGATGASATPRTITWPSGVTGPTGADPVEYVGTYALTVTTSGCNIENNTGNDGFYDDLRVRIVRLDGADPGLIQGTCGQSVPGSGLQTSWLEAEAAFTESFNTIFPGLNRFQRTHFGASDLYFSDDPSGTPNNSSSTYGGGWIRCDSATGCSVLERMTTNGLHQQFPSVMSQPFIIRRAPLLVPIPAGS